MKAKICLSFVLVTLLLGVSSCDFTSRITFGIWSDTSAVKLEKVQSVFTPSETISCEIPFGNKIGTTSIKFQLTKKNATMMIQSWDQDIDPEITDYVYKFWMPDPEDKEADPPLEPGEYALNVYKKDLKIASGTFTVK